MALESAKCPNCAAEIQVPNDREDAFCTYCGSTVKTKAAIGYFQVELKGKVQIDTDPTVQAKLQRGRETGDLRYFKEVLDIDPYCAEARKVFSEIYLIGKLDDKYGSLSMPYKVRDANNDIFYEMTGECSSRLSCGLFIRIKKTMNLTARFAILGTYDKHYYLTPENVDEALKRYVFEYDLLPMRYLFGDDFDYLDTTIKKEVIDALVAFKRNDNDTLDGWKNFYSCIKEEVRLLRDYIFLLDFKRMLSDETSEIFHYLMMAIRDVIPDSWRSEVIKKKTGETLESYFREVDRLR